MAEAAAVEEEVIIVGAGQSGLAAAACLSLRGVRSLVLERDDCVGSLWRKRSYDRVRLHLAKQYCALPHAPHPDDAPTYLPRDDFIRYLDAYASRFGVRTRLRREVEAVDLGSGKAERYKARFLVVAAGENDEKFVPEVPGIESFPGKVVHAAEYRSPEGMRGKSVLVVGCGNSGMEIAYDLADAGAVTSIVVRGELHLVSKEIWNVVMAVHTYLPWWLLDKLVLLMCTVVFGDTAKYGLRRPAVGPFTMKCTTPVYPVVDVGTYAKIKSGEVRVLNAAVKSVRGNVVEFADGRQHPFDAIVFATGYRSTVRRWLKSDGGLIGDDGMAARSYPEHWKGENGLYCAGMVRRGIYGSCEDAEFIAEDISKQLRPQAQTNGNKHRWEVEAVDLGTGAAEAYQARFLVVATGTYDEKVVPALPGLESFPGEVMHASEYKSAKGMEGKAVLVVGCGNSGMEIALDLAEAGALTSIVVRGELHILTKGILNLGVRLGMHLPIWLLDKLVLFLCYLVFGDTSKHGLRRPAMGPFARTQQTAALPVIDVGTYKKIKSGEIQVLPAIRSVHGNTVEFVDGRQYPFDAIVFATGYRSAMKRWLQVLSRHKPIDFIGSRINKSIRASSLSRARKASQVDEAELIADGENVRQRRPKAKNGLYFAGMSGRGIYGSGTDAEFIADDISKQLRPQSY
ncbi:hypothetical protein EJB05_32345, partial [Eragrostis curvula]